MCRSKSSGLVSGPLPAETRDQVVVTAECCFSSWPVSREIVCLPLQGSNSLADSQKVRETRVEKFGKRQQNERRRRTFLKMCWGCFASSLPGAWEEFFNRVPGVCAQIRPAGAAGAQRAGASCFAFGLLPEASGRVWK